MEQVQRRATRLFKECKDLRYTERSKFLKLHSPTKGRLGGDLTETYTIFNNLEDTKFQDLFSVAKSDKTRNAEGKLYVETLQY